MKLSLALGALLASLLLACGSSTTNGAAPSNDAGTTDSGGGGNDGGAPSDPRQALRDESIFQNLDFEDVDATGALTAWKCYCGNTSVACKTSTTNPEHGQRSLVLGSGCLAYQETTSFDATKGLRYDFFAQGARELPGASYVLGSATDGSYESLYTDGFATAPKSWTDLASRGALPTSDKHTLEILLYNSDGGLDYPTADGPDLAIDDVIAVQDQANPPPKVGSLLHATHYDQLSVAASATPGSIYLSLPIDWASQTPLYFELTVDPPSIVDHVVYATEAENNWGATLVFAANQAASSVVVKWDAVVLDRATPDAELPTVFAANGDPNQWLSTSSIIESTDSGISTTASGLLPAGSTPLATMLSVIGWTSKNITYNFPTGNPGLDASTAYNLRQTTCTGYANLAAAMGRSLSLPARHITNILVGESQDLHSINEFYLGADLGWRRVEPQGTSARVPDDYGFIMRIVLPGDESPVADRAGVGGELILGIPSHEFSEIVSGPSTMGFASTTIDTFSDCSYCGNHADPQSDLRDTTPDAMKALFTNARTHWETDMAEYNANGGLSSAKMTTRRQALTAKTMADVSTMLSALP